MEVIQSLISNDKYGVKCPYSMTPIGICIHNTANDASARNEVAYGKSNNNEVSYHIAVDDIEAIQWIPLNRNAWHAGDGGSGEGNRKYIAIEICYSKSGGVKFDKAEKNCAVLVAQMLKEHGWGIDRVKKHQDFSGKYCPHRTLDLGWQRFLNMVQAKLNEGNSQPISKPNNDVIYRVKLANGEQIGAFRNLDSAKNLAQINKCNVYKSTDNSLVISYVSNPNVASKVINYRVKRKNGQQLGAFNSYENAEILAKKEKAIVYDKNNKIVKSFVPDSGLGYLNLKPHMATWRVYPVDGAYTKGNEVGYLAPKTYGGLSYKIYEKKATDVYKIKTETFGYVAIYAPKDNDSSITSLPIY